MSPEERCTNGLSHLTLQEVGSRVLRVYRLLDEASGMDNIEDIKTRVAAAMAVIEDVV